MHHYPPLSIVRTSPRVTLGTLAWFYNYCIRQRLIIDHCFHSSSLLAFAFSYTVIISAADSDGTTKSFIAHDKSPMCKVHIRQQQKHIIKSNKDYISEEHVLQKFRLVIKSRKWHLISTYKIHSLLFM